MNNIFKLNTVAAKAIALIAVLLVVSIVSCAAFILNHFEKIMGPDRLMQILAGAEEMLNPASLPYSLENGVLKLGNRVLNNDNETTDHLAKVFRCSASLTAGSVRVATSNKTADGKRKTGTNISQEIVQAVLVEGKTYSSVQDVAGESHIAAYMPLKDKNGVIVGALGVGFVTEKFNEVFHNAQMITALSGLVLTILSVGIGYFVFRRLFAPFKPLGELMEDARDGRYTTDVPYTDRSDEFGTLAGVIFDFNKAMKQQHADRIAAEAEKARAAEEQKHAEEEAMRRSEQLVVSTFGQGLKALAEEKLEYRLTAEVPTAYRGLKDDFNQAMETAQDNLRQREADARQRESDRIKAEEAQKAAEEAARQAGIDLVVSSFGEGLKALANRDLTYRLTMSLPVEYQVLQNDFNAAMTQIESAMREIHSSAGEIADNCNEISQGAHEMAQRTERQAASLEETAAAVNEITATVGKSADGAASANNRAVAAKQGAERSNDIAEMAVNAMREIAKSSSEISQIIGVIDEIAFQTNLLALNAGVEAARAGDAGKGFAVVASEVRALAQRSAQAAKEIKALIEMSESQVETGVKLVEDSGSSLQGIVEDIGVISQLVAEIAQSQREQANALAEIDSAVSEMDKDTQQNAAMAEQSNAAAEALAGFSRDMEQLVTRFEIAKKVAVAPAKPIQAPTQKAKPQPQGSSKPVTPKPPPQKPVSSQPAMATPAAKPSVPAASPKPAPAVAAVGNTALAVSRKPSAKTEEDWEEF